LLRASPEVASLPTSGNATVSVAEDRILTVSRTRWIRRQGVRLIDDSKKRTSAVRAARRRDRAGQTSTKTSGNALRS